MNENRYACEPKLDFPLHLAGRKKDNEMVKLFIEAGAAVDAKNVKCSTRKSFSQTLLLSIIQGVPSPRGPGLG